MSLTLARLDEIEEAASKSTPGPWHWVNPLNDLPWLGQSYASLRTVAKYGKNETKEINGAHYTTFALPKFILEVEEITNKDDATFIAACDPQTVLALVRIARAAITLSNEGQEYEFDDGLGRGAPNSYWEDLDEAIDPVMIV